jgi:hypothetical protein
LYIVRIVRGHVGLGGPSQGKEEFLVIHVVVVVER